MCTHSLHPTLPALSARTVGRKDYNAKGWAGLHGREDNNDVTVVVLCPECWAKEFSDES